MRDKCVRKLMREIMTISRGMIYIRDVQFKNMNIGKGQYAFLTRIMESPGITQEEISNGLKMDKTTVAKSIQRLEDMGYIRKIENEKDRRERLLYPTEKLENIYDEIVSRIMEVTKDSMEGVELSEMEYILPILHKINENVNKKWLKIR